MSWFFLEFGQLTLLEGGLYPIKRVLLSNLTEKLQTFCLFITSVDSQPQEIAEQLSKVVYMERPTSRTAYKTRQLFQRDLT